MTDAAVYRRNNVLWRSTYDRVVIQVPGRDGFLTLHATGCDLWVALEEPGTLQALAQRLAVNYGAPVEQIASDIVAVLDDLARCGAVVVTSTSP